MTRISQLVALLFVLTFSGASFAAPVYDDCCCETGFLDCLAQCNQCLIPSPVILPKAMNLVTPVAAAQKIAFNHQAAIPFALKVPVPPPKIARS